MTSSARAISEIGTVRPRGFGRVKSSFAYRYFAGVQVNGLTADVHCKSGSK